ncbi:hypothetical protein [Lacihabitans sp. LS3-19]|uniref:hypothetical protein n=1 Tax=Lacihabitans sp. LS3-19 TaxID=2487335 RepID=UPI0020CD066F|nr:hypothetical protein [Lacihabitans sp. LS3-19]
MRLIFFIFLSFLNASFVFGQTTYYLSPVGNDNSLFPNNINTPWKSFKKACDNAQPGDLIYFRGNAGVYSEKNINCSCNGSTTSPIVFKAYNNEIPIFNGGGVTPEGSYFLSINGSSNVRLEGLRFENMINKKGFALKITGESTNIVLSQLSLENLFFSPIANDTPNVFSDTFNPLVVFGNSLNSPITGIEISNCEIKNCRTGQSEAISVVGNVQNYSIVGNHINNTGNIGIVAVGYYNWGIPNLENFQTSNGLIKGNLVEYCKSKKALAAGIYIDGARDVIVEGNTCRYGQRGFAVNCENHLSVNGAAAIGNIIRNNQAYGNSRGGFSIGACKGQAWCTNGNVINTTLINNTSVNNWDPIVFEPGETSVHQDFGELTLDKSENTNIRNNIFFSSIDSRYKLLGSYQLQIPFVSNLSSDWNIWFNSFTPLSVFQLNNDFKNGLGLFKQDFNQDPNSVDSNPNFKNVLNNDYQLNNLQSVGIGLSDPSITFVELAGAKDFNNRDRLVNQKIDAGAFEYGCVSNDLNLNAPLQYSNQTFQTKGTINLQNSILAPNRLILNSEKAIILEPTSNLTLGSNVLIEVRVCPDN